MKRYVKIIMCIVLLFSAIFLSHSLAKTNGQSSVVDIDPGGSVNLSFNDTDYGSTSSSNSPTVPIEVTSDGFYTISMDHNAKTEQFEIVDENGNIVTLAGFNTNSGVSYGGTNYEDMRVTVKLEAGKKYYLVGYYNSDANTGVAVYNIKRENFDESSYFDTGVLSSEYSAPRLLDSNYGSSDVQIRNRNQRGERKTREDFATDEEWEEYKKNVIDGMPGKVNLLGSNSENTDFVQRTISWLFVHGLADPLKAIISGLFGDVTIDKVLFNEFQYTNLAFYKETGKGDENRKNIFLESQEGKNILSMVSDFYNLFRMIATAIYIGLFIFIAIRIVWASTGPEKEKYKTMIVDWCKGAALLTIIPYFIKYSIITNEAVVALIRTEIVNKSDNISLAQGAMPKLNSVSEEFESAIGKIEDVESADIMMSYRKKSLDDGSLVYALIYIFLLIQMLGIILMYFRRLISILFLIITFPFVAVSYAVDKIKDGQAQIFNSWLKEFLLNVFMQFFQAIVYVTVTYLIGALMVQEAGASGSGANLLMVIIAIRYIAKSESLLRALFPSFMSGGSGVGTTKPLESELKAITNTTLLKRATRNLSAMNKKVHNMTEKTNAFIEGAYEYRADANQRNQQWRNEREYDEQAQRINSGSSFENATKRLVEVPADGSDSERASAGDERKKELDKKMQALDDLSMARKDSTLREKYDSFMRTKTEEERRALERQMDAKESINEILTGKDRDGRTLSKKELAIRAKIVVDVIKSGGGGPREYRELHEWMKSKTMSVQERVFDGGEISEEEGLRRQAAGQRVRVKTTTREVAVTDYLDGSSANQHMVDVKTGRATTMKKGRGVMGLYVSEADADTIKKAQMVFGGGGSSISTAKSDDLAMHFDEDADGHEGTNRMALDNPDALSVRREATADEIVSISEDEMYRIWSAEKDRIREFAHGFYKIDDKKADARERSEIDEAAELVFELSTYMARVNGINAGGHSTASMDASEAFRISSRLNQLRQRNGFVASLVDSSVQVSPTTPIFHDEEDHPGYSVDLGGISLERVEVISGQATIQQNGSLSDKKRKALTQSAIDTLSRETVDPVIAAMIARSETDDLLGDAPLTKLDSEAKIKRKGKTQEQILEEAFKKELKAEQERMVSTEVSKKRAELFGKGIEAVGSIASVVVGEPLRMGTGIATAAAVSGASDEPELSGILTSFEAGTKFEEGAEKLIPGSVSAGSKGTVGSFIANAATTIEEETRRDREMKRIHDGGKASDPNDPIYRSAAERSKAANRSREIRGRLNNL